MRIIKHGKLPEPRRVRFTCQHCGCVYECRQGEYLVRSQYNELYAACRCPECDTGNTADYKPKG